MRFRVFAHNCDTKNIRIAKLLLWLRPFYEGILKKKTAISYAYLPITSIRSANAVPSCMSWTRSLMHCLPCFFFNCAFTQQVYAWIWLYHNHSNKHCHKKPEARLLLGNYIILAILGMLTSLAILKTQIFSWSREMNLCNSKKQERLKTPAAPCLLLSIAYQQQSTTTNVEAHFKPLPSCVSHYFGLSRAAEHSDCCFFALCTNILTYLLTSHEVRPFNSSTSLKTDCSRLNSIRCTPSMDWLDWQLTVAAGVAAATITFDVTVDQRSEPVTH